MKRKVYMAEPPNFNYTLEDYYTVIKSIFRAQFSNKIDYIDEIIMLKKE